MLYRVIKCEYWDNSNRCVYYLNDRSLVQESRLVPVPFSLRFYDARQRMIYLDAIRQQMNQAVMHYKKGFVEINRFYAAPPVELLILAT